MKPTILLLTALLLALPIVLHGADADPGGRPGDLRCEYRHDPLGIDVARPGLSWKLEAAGAQQDDRGQRQTAYHVLVASTAEQLAQDKGDLWDSGKVASDQSIHVEYAGNPLLSRIQCFWKVRVWTARAAESGVPSPESKKSSTLPGSHFTRRNLSEGGSLEGEGGNPSAWSETARWTMGLLKPSDPSSTGSAEASWSAEWITHPDPKRLSHPWLRRSFELKDRVKGAVIYVNTASYYELRINGKKVGPYVLEPGITQVDKRFFVNAYDVANYLVKGANTIALWMGPGWHQPRNGNTNNAPILRAQLTIDTHSGPMVIGTDASWRIKESCVSQIGPWKWNNFGGERFDAREFVEGWDQVGFDDSQWTLAREIPAPYVAHSWQGCESARLSEPIKPVEIRRLQNGKWVIDFGRPLTGWMRLKMHDLKAGQEVQINYADIDDNLNVRKLAYKTNADGFQDFNQKDVFISAGKSAETFCSRFNYHSFRYAVIAGLDREPSINDAEAMMIEPDLESAGSFECSNDLYNQIHEITRYTFRTQNPCLALGAGEAREKTAYGDGGAHLSGYLYNFTCDANLKKWILDWSDVQRDDGWFHHTAPSFEDHGGGPAWGGQASELVRRMYLYYGDRGVVEQMYDKLKKYIDFLETKTRDDVLRSYSPTSREEAMMFIGDWARPAATAGQGFNLDNKDEREVFNNAYRVLLWQQLQDFAAGIGRTDEVKRCAERLAVLRPIVHSAFYQEDKGAYRYSSQSSLAMMLYARIPPPELRSRIMAQLENMIVVEKKGHLDTGLLGTFVLLDLLIRENRNDLVDLIMGQTTYPGWGYLVKELGLKTWPETWSGWGSHVILVTATPGSWFFEGLGGILPDPANPGFKHFLLRPGIVKSVKWVKCSYQSPYGKIVSNWKCEGDKLTLDVTIPPNTTATVYVPTKDAAAVTEGGNAIDKVEGVKFLRMENGAAVYVVASGTYHFQSRMVPPAAIHAANATPALQPSSPTGGTAVSQERMQQVYEEVKTPNKSQPKD
jgi:alpha-L-rhamnosidase